MKPLSVLMLAISALSSLACHSQQAPEYFGAYSIVPVSAPGMCLQPEGGNVRAGSIVTIGKPVSALYQRWKIVNETDGKYVTLRPAGSADLVLTALNGGAGNGTPVVLQPYSGKSYQRWKAVKLEDGSYNLVPEHAPEKGLDDFGGKQEPGSRQDLWQNSAGDVHLQWMLKPLGGSLLPAAGAADSTTQYAAPEISPEKILRGTIQKFTFSSSKIFPGTVRDVVVFVPAQYTSHRPACVYVKTDGYGDIEKELLETMIATHEIPVMVGIFVRPGDTPAPTEGLMGRRNRCLEYDGITDDNVRFLNEELIPEVAKRYGLNLSASGNDRCIAGGSSGAIAAFTAAWHRPDLFSRAYVNSGSFVAFRSGHEYPTLVRKTEPKPIRAFLTTGTRDMENAAGDWFLLDQEMDKALKFSGYDYRFRIVNGGHVAGYYDYYREAMSYLWKGWPTAIKPGAGAPRFRDFADTTLPFSLATTLPGEAVSAASAPDGSVVLALKGRSAVLVMDTSGAYKTLPVIKTGSITAVAFGPENQILCGASDGSIYSRSASGVIKVLAKGIHASHLLARSDGTVYAQSSPDGAVWALNASGKRRVLNTVKAPGGLAIRPDGWLLATADGASHWITSAETKKNGQLINAERFFTLHVPDWKDSAETSGLCYSREGQLFCATNAGIQVCADDGPTQVIMSLPDGSGAKALCIGGIEQTTLFAFSGRNVWKRQLKVHYWSPLLPPVKVNGTPL